MMRYTVKRIVTGILSLFLLVTITFFLVRMMPGSPFQTGAVSEMVVEAVEEEYGLNRPVMEQYVSYIENLLRGDLGISYQEPGTTVKEVIARACPLTLSIGIPALILSVIAGSLLGILCAVTKKKAVRKLITAGGMVAAGIPGFAAAILLLLVFSLKLKWLPSSGLLTPAHYVLPVLSLALYPTAVVTRLMANTMAMEMKKPYMLFARAKGLKPMQVLLGHGLKNAWLPVMNYIGPASAYLLTGSFVVESIFTIPGLGREFVSSITNRDYTMILGLTVFMGFVIITVNLLTDLICTWMDPVLRRTYGEDR